MYATLDEADAYLESVLDTDAWDYSTDVRRTKALKQATNIIKSLNIPSFEEPYPQDIKDATVEIALALLAGKDPEQALEDASLQSVSFNTLKKTFKQGETPLHILAGVPSAKAFNLLKGYMPNPTTVHLSRIN